MPCGIARRIAFRLHDPPTHPPFGQIADHDLANQKPRELQSVAGKFFSSEAAKFEVREFHGLLRAYIRRLIVKQPREFRMINHDRGIQLDGIKVFLLEGVTRFRRSKHFTGERNSRANVFRRNGIFARKRLIQPNDKLGNIVKPPELLVVNDQPEKFSHRDFPVGAFVLAALHIQERFVNAQQRQPERDQFLTCDSVVVFPCERSGVWRVHVMCATFIVRQFAAKFQSRTPVRPGRSG